MHYPSHPMCAKNSKEKNKKKGKKRQNKPGSSLNIYFFVILCFSFQSWPHSSGLIIKIVKRKGGEQNT